MIKAIITTIIGLTFLSLEGCLIGKTLARDVPFEGWTINYSTYCGNTANHKPCQILVQARSGYKAMYKMTHYWFDEQTESVAKGEDIGRQRKGKPFYLIAYADSTDLKFEERDIAAQNNPALKFGSIVTFSALDSFVFSKLIELSDSAHIRNFRFLLKAQGFRQITEIKTE